MNDGVEILLARIQTNPEEFFSEDSKWSYVLDNPYFKKSLTPDESDALNNALKEVYRQELTSVVMRILLNENKNIRNLLR